MSAKPLLCVPSWVIPGTYTENLSFLEDKKEISCVELLFFLYDDEIKKQLDAEWEAILRYRERFIFTAHLPEKLCAAHEELVSRLSPIVRHFIVHPVSENQEAQAHLLKEWTARYKGSPFLAEYTQSGLLEAMLPHLERDAGLCMDTGHLLLAGLNPAEFFRTYRERIGEIHLHGVDRDRASRDGRLPDHRPIREEPWLDELLPLLKDYGGVINLEVFSWEEVRAGIEVLQNKFINEPVPKLRI